MLVLKHSSFSEAHGRANNVILIAVIPNENKRDIK